MDINQTRLIAELRIYARSLCRNRAEADWLVREAIKAALEEPPKTHSDVQIRTVLFRLMRKRHYGTIVAPERGRADEEIAPCVFQDAFGSSSDKAQQEITHAIQNMPVHFREAIVLMAIVGDSREHAAATMECSIDAVNDRLETAQSLLRAQLMRIG